MRKNTKALIIVIVIFLAVLLYIRTREITLKKNGILLNAKTLKWTTVSKGRVLEYEFFYEGRQKLGSNSIESIRGVRDFEFKYFPIMYDPKLCMSQLLIEPSEFERFNIPFLDSLKWVLPYLK